MMRLRGQMSRAYGGQSIFTARCCQDLLPFGAREFNPRCLKSDGKRFGQETRSVMKATNLRNSHRGESDEFHGDRLLRLKVLWPLIAQGRADALDIAKEPVQ